MPPRGPVPGPDGRERISKRGLKALSQLRRVGVGGRRKNLKKRIERAAAPLHEPDGGELPNLKKRIERKNKPFSRNYTRPYRGQESQKED